MNKVFNVVWDNAAQNWVAVSELAKANNVLATSPIISEVEELSHESYKTNSYQLSAIAATLMLAGITLFTTPNVYANTATGALTDAQLKQILKVNGVDSGNAATAERDGGIALGKGATSKGKNSIAIGNNTTASDENQVALGSNASVGGSRGAVAIGYGSRADNGESAVAIGSTSNASADKAIAIGIGSMANQSNAVAIGGGSKALKHGVIAIGLNSTAEGGKSISIGENTTVSGLQSSAIGDNVNVTGSDTFVLGNSVYANTSNSVILGNSSNGNATATTVTNATVANVTYGNFTGTPQTTGHYVSVGDKGNERQVKFVAAGEITADSTDAINGSQLYAVLNKPAMTTGKVEAKGGKAVPDNSTGNLATVNDVADTINNVHWNVTGKDAQGNNANFTVKAGDQVKFDNSSTTTVAIDPTHKAISFDVKTTGITTTPNGTAAVDPNGNGTSLVNGTTVSNAINNSHWTARGTDATGKAIDVKVNPGSVITFANGTGTMAVLAKDGTVSINLATGKIDVDDKGKATPPTDENKGNLVNTTTVTNVINNTSWTADVKNDNTVKITATNATAKVKAGDTLNVVAGQNLQAAFDENRNLTLTTRENVTFNSVNVGGDKGVNITTNENGGLKVANATTGDPVQITNVAPGLNHPNGTVAIKNYSELVNVTGDILKNVVTVADLKAILPTHENKDLSDNTGKGPFFVSVSAKEGTNGQANKLANIEGDVTKIEPNQTLDIEADKNISVTLKNKGVQIATNDNVDFKSVTTEKLALKGADGKDGKPGKSADIIFEDGKGTIKPGEEKGIDRIKYTTNVTYPNGTTVPTTRELATMDDGLIFKGDTGSEIRSPLGSTVNIVGGARGSLTNNNIGVESDGSGTLAVRLAKDINLGPDGSITIGGTTINNGSITGLKGTLPVTDNTTVKAPPLPTDATPTSSKAATVGDILNAGWNIQENGEAKDFVKHGDAVNFKNGTGTKVVIEKDATTGTTSVSVNSPMAYINGNGDTSTPSNAVRMVGKDNAPVAIRNVSSGLVDNETGKPVTLSQAKGDTLTNAANIGDLKAVTQGIRNDIDNINNDIHDLDKRVRGIGASSAAASSLPQVMTAGKSMVSASAGGYSGASAVAVGYSRASDSGKLILKLTGTANSEGHYSGGVGMGYQF